MASITRARLDVSSHSDHTETVTVSVTVAWSHFDRQHKDVPHLLRGYLVEREDELDFYAISSGGKLERLRRGATDDRIMNTPFQQLQITPEGGEYYELTSRFDIGKYTRHGGKENLVAIVTLYPRDAPPDIAVTN